MPRHNLRYRLHAITNAKTWGSQIGGNKGIATS